MYDIEKMYQATSVQDAVEALSSDENAVIISGGSDVLIKIREGKFAGISLVSVHNLAELKGVRMDKDGTIIIGAGTSFSHVTNDATIKQYLPMLGDAVDQAGGPQLRNVGTIGGNVCNGATSADSAPSLFALNAELVLQGTDGTRTVPITQFYTGPGKTVRDRCEVLTEIHIKKDSYENVYGHYIKYGKRRAMEIATLGCACTVKLSADKTVLEEMHLAFGVAAPTPIRCPKTEAAVNGKKISTAMRKEIGKTALDEVSPRSSWRASKEFRIQLVEELAKRAFTQAVAFAGGKIDA